MQDNSQQTPNPRTPSGYRPLIPAELSGVASNPAYAYIAAAAGVGLLVGLGIAVGATAGHAKVTAAPPSAAISSQASGLPSFQASFTGPAQSLLSVVDPSKKVDAATPHFALVNDASKKKVAALNKRRGLQRLWPWKKGSEKRDNAKRKPYVSPNSPGTSEEPTALELATAAAATGPFVLGIQGDATIASYDVATGTVETYEGSSFVLDKANRENGAIPFQDFPFNVHYSCDQNNSCTIVRHGATANARLMR
jgi:hypothetical protein